MQREVTEGDFSTLDFVGSGPRGSFSGFADSRSTLVRWVNGGYMHLHPGQRVPTHHQVCACQRYGE